MARKAPKLPRIGPCRDPLHLWFLEYLDARFGVVYRRYFATRDEARAALRQRKGKA